MLEELQWKQGSVNITTNDTFNDYKYIEAHQPSTNFWKKYKKSASYTKNYFRAGF